MLRQALEAKFERIVQVIPYNTSGDTPKLKHDFHYSFIKTNVARFQFTSVNFSLLEHIYQWCNVIVHSAVQPFAWQVPYAQETCSGLFASGPSRVRGGGWSIHGGVRILDKDSMQEAFAKHFCNSYDHGVWCIEYGEPEAVWQP